MVMNSVTTNVQAQAGWLTVPEERRAGQLGCPFPLLRSCYKWNFRLLNLTTRAMESPDKMVCSSLQLNSWTILHHSLILVFLFLSLLSFPFHSLLMMWLFLIHIIKYLLLPSVYPFHLLFMSLKYLKNNLHHFYLLEISVISTIFMFPLLQLK